MNLACLQPRPIKCNVCGCEVTKIGSVAARAIGWWYLADLDTWRCPQHMTWQEFRPRLLAICDQLDAVHPAGDPGMRNAIEASSGSRPSCVCRSRPGSQSFVQSRSRHDDRGSMMTSRGTLQAVCSAATFGLRKPGLRSRTRPVERSRTLCLLRCAPMGGRSTGRTCAGWRIPNE